MLHDRDYHIVIVPTAPIPFGGALLFVPVESVMPANMSIDGLMSVYMSMGVSAAEEYLPQRAKTPGDVDTQSDAPSD